METSETFVEVYAAANTFHAHGMECVGRNNWYESHTFLCLAIKKLEAGLSMVPEGNEFLKSEFSDVLGSWKTKLAVVQDNLRMAIANRIRSGITSAKCEDENSNATSITSSTESNAKMEPSDADPAANAGSDSDIALQPPAVAGNSNEMTIPDMAREFKLAAERGLPPISMKDIVGYQNVKTLMHRLFVIPKAFPQCFPEERDAENILLYGHPGCGKSCFASAIAREYAGDSGDCYFISITPADINGKFIGESEKRLKALFLFAESVQRIVIFFDELDGLFPSRSMPGNVGSKALVTQFLTLSQGVHAAERSKNILLVGATNLPLSIDEGVLRRFKKHIEIGLPDAVTREQLFLHYYGKDNYDKIIEKCPMEFFENEMNDYTCADVKAFVQNLLEIPIFMAMESTRFVYKEVVVTATGDTFRNKWMPCFYNEQQEGAVEMSLENIAADDLYLPPPTVEPDFFAVIASMKPTACLPPQDMLRPKSMKEGLDYYKQNHGFSPDKLREYYRKYFANLELQRDEQRMKMDRKEEKQASAASSSSVNPHQPATYLQKKLKKLKKPLVKLMDLC